MQSYREILMIGLGTTPQVFTECLYYYSHAYYGDVRHFDEVKVYTTVQGKLKLLEAIAEGRLIALEKELNRLEPFNFDPERDIIVYEDAQGRPIDDMRSSDVMSDSMLRLYDDFRNYTAEDDSRIIATVAGGRKSMSAAMALAFQLYAREQDELFHILAPNSKMSTLENLRPEWYFPTDPDDPEQLLEVTQIPVVKVGRYLPVDLKREPRDLINTIQSRLFADAPIQRLIVDGRIFSDGENKINLQPRLAVILRYLIRRRLNASCEDDCSGCEKCTATFDDLRDAIRSNFFPDYKALVGRYSPIEEKYQKRRSLPPNIKDLEDDENAKKIADLNGVLSEDLSNLRKTIKSKCHRSGFMNALQIDHNDLKGSGRHFGILVNRQIIQFDQ